MIGDAFGEMLKAASTGRPVFAAMERDDDLLTPHDPAMYFTGPSEWGELEVAACARVSGRVLDVGCGAGRHALYLQEQGSTVTGVDVSAGACEVSRARGVHDVRQVGLAGLGELAQVGERYDTFLLLGANLGLIGGDPPAALAALASVAAPGARILGGLGFSRSDDPVQQAYYARNEAAGRLPGTLRIRTRFGNLADPWVSLLLCTPDELRSVVEGSPWRLTTVDGDDQGYLAELSLSS
ncbi:class I SAM-dependent methyltransferase [Flindersiella endophytica]